VTKDNPLLTGKISLAHLTEFPDYYTRLAKKGGRSQVFLECQKVEIPGALGGISKGQPGIYICHAFND